MWELDHKEGWMPQMLSNSGVGKDSWEPVGQQGNQIIKSTLNIHWKDWCRSSNTLATWCQEPIHWKRPDAGKGWGQEKKGLTGSDSRMASQIQCTWLWKNSRWWRTGKPGVLQFIGLQTVRYDWATEQQLTKCCQFFCITIYFYLHPISPGLLRHPCLPYRCTCYFLS